MSTRYVQQAQQQLNPGYDQQSNALQAQIPAIQQLYSSLNQGLGGQQQTANQNVLEDSSGRGLLHSTIPVVGQQQVASNILQQQGQNSLNQAKDIFGVQGQIAGLKTDQASAIAQLAQALASSDLQQQQFTYDKQQSNKQYSLALKAAKQGF